MKDSTLGLPDSFYEEELDQVILAVARAQSRSPMPARNSIGLLCYAADARWVYQGSCIFHRAPHPASGRFRRHQNWGGEAALPPGVQAYRQSKFDEAIRHFEKCVALAPGNTVAHLYLATSYVQEYIPGVDTPENNRMVEQATLRTNSIEN